MTTRVQAVLISLALLAFTIGLAGCGHYKCQTGFGDTTCGQSGGSSLSQGNGSSTTSAYVFVVDQVGTMDGYSLITGGSSGSGSFAATTGYTAPTIPKNDFGAAVEAQGKYLYATFHTTEQIYGWTIGSGGGLTAISGMPLTLSFLAGVGYNSQGRTSVITNPAGTLLFLADSLSNQIYVYSIGSGGALTAVSGSPFSTGFSLQGLTTDGLGKYLYAIENGDSIGAYAISSSGALTTVPGSPFLSTMTQIAGEPTGNYLIGTTGAGSGTGSSDAHLYVFGITQSGTSAGAISQPSAISTQFSPFSIAVSPNSNGDLVYSFSINPTDTGFNGIEGYTISNGTLTMDSGSPFTGVTLGSWGQFDPSGAYLVDYGVIVNSDGSTTIQMGGMQVGSGGALTQSTPQLTFVSPGSWAVSDVP